ncbi:hypothetical protein C5167_027089 [Papaver somniferum]|nr:hypothetical protein C5167_027089 [Papaver somniferum]
MTLIYVIGTWFVKSLRETLVWTTNRNDVPLSSPSSIFLTNEGKFVLRVADNNDAPLVPDVNEAVSYAVMHDDGNFVLYASDSKILWQSFDHPTDTILRGQKLKDGVDHISSVSVFNQGSGKYKLSVNQNDGLVAIYKFRRLEHDEEASSLVVSKAFADSLSKPVTLNLDIGGNLYLVGSDNVVIRVLYESKTQQGEDTNVYIYRVKLNPNGHFNVYKERIDGMGDKKSVGVQLWSTYTFWTSDNITYILLLTAFVALIGACTWCGVKCKSAEELRRGL